MIRLGKYCTKVPKYCSSIIYKNNLIQPSEVFSYPSALLLIKPNPAYRFIVLILESESSDLWDIPIMLVCAMGLGFPSSVTTVPREYLWKEIKIRFYTAWF